MKKFVAFLVIVSIMAFGALAFADDPITTRPHTWTDKQWFNSDVMFRDKITYGQAVSVVKTPVIVTMSGQSVYTIDPDKGSWFCINDVNSTLGTRVSSGVSIILPPISKNLNYYTVRIQKMPFISGVSMLDAGTGTTKIVISTTPWAGASGTTDGIWNVTTGVTRESSTLVMPEVSEIDASGDWLEFIALYNATSGSTWYQIGRYIQ